MKHQLLFSLALFFSLIFSGCGSSSSSSSKKNDVDNSSNGVTDVDQLAACAQIEWQSGHWQSLDSVVLRGFDTDLTELLDDPDVELVVRAYPAGLKEVYYPLPVFIEETEEGKNLVFTAPFNTNNPYEQQSFDFELLVNDVVCTYQNQPISGLEKSEGAADIDFTALEINLVTAANELSKENFNDYAVLKGRYESMLARQEEVTADVGLLLVLLNVERLEQMQKAFSQLSNEERVLLSSVFSQMGFQERLSDFSQYIESLAPTNTTPQGNQFMVMGTTLGGGVCQSINNFSITEPINTAEQLQNAMEIQDRNEAIKRLTDSRLLDAGITAAALSGAVSGGASTVIAGGLYLTQTIAAFNAGTKPSLLTNLAIDLDRREIPEDWLESGEVAPTWRKAQLTASSTGYNLTGAAIGLLVELAGVAKYASTAGKVGGQAGKVDQFVEAALEDISSSDSHGLYVLVNEIVGEQSCLQIHPKEWTVDVTDEEWSKSLIIGDSVKLEPESSRINSLAGQYQQLNPINIGSSTLVVGTQPDKFLGQVLTARENIKVVSTSVSLSPKIHRVYEEDLEKQELIPIAVMIQNTARPHSNFILDLSRASGFDLDDDPQLITSGDTWSEWRFFLAASENKSDYPATIKAYRDSVLPDDNQERMDVMSIILVEEKEDEELSILTIQSPDKKCLEEGESLQLHAIDLTDGSPITGASWSTDTGSISKDGLFTAPMKSEAHSSSAIIQVSNEHGTDHQSIQLGDCSCWWNAKVTGPFTEQHSAEDMEISINEDGDIIGLGFWGDLYFSGEDALTHAPIDIDLFENPIPAGATGQFSAHVDSGGTSSAGWNNDFYSDYDQPVTVTITEHRMHLPSEENFNISGARTLSGKVTGAVKSWPEYSSYELSGSLELEWHGINYWHNSQWIMMGFEALHSPYTRYCWDLDDYYEQMPDGEYY